MEKDYIEQLVEQIKSIDTSELSDDVDKNPNLKIVEQQKTYFWIRLYLKEENNNIEIGDDVVINYTPIDEKLVTKFICYGKKNIEKDYENEVTNYDPEDNKKVLCLMIDESAINENDEIPFIRSLFKLSRHYEYQLVKRDELLFTVEKNNIILDYFDCDF
jgi:hypothetical protein